MTVADGAPTGSRAELTRGVTLAMAVACGVMVANIYYNQPLLGIMERDFPGQPAIGFVPTATQLGYALGIILLVPLGDELDRRKLIIAQIGALVLALALVALAPGPSLVLIGSALVGITGSVAQQILPLAAELAQPAKRGVTIGTVMSGLLCGILFGRTAAGFIGQHFGWRAVFGLAIVTAAAIAVLMAAVLPRSAPRARMPYWALLRSLLRLFGEEPQLRVSTGIQTALFASFSAFWTILALKLERPPYELGADVAGLFGILGATGVLVAPVVGRIADRRGPRIVVGLGIALVIASWLVMAASLSMAALILGVLLLDVGVQCAMISNQHRVFALRPEARNRMNTVFVSGIFVGGALGSAGASIIWHAVGWTGVCAFGAALGLTALAVHVLVDRSWKAAVA